jgi:hypothetical protein
MAIYISIGAATALALPFPVSLLVALGAFVSLNFIRTRRMLKRAGVDVKGLFRSLSPSSSAPMNGVQYNPIKYYCISWEKSTRKLHVPAAVRR